MLYVAGDDPDDAWLEADGPRTATVPWVVTAVGLIFLIPGSLIFLSGTTTALKRKHVLEVGQPFTGKVIGVESSNFRVNNVTYSQYRFVWKGVDGLEHEATSLPFPPNQVKYDEGDPITVYSDPTDPDSGEVDLTGFRGTAPR